MFIVPFSSGPSSALGLAGAEPCAQDAGTFPSYLRHGDVFSVFLGITEATLQDADAPLVVVAGSRDEFYPAERSEQMARALERRARSVELRIYDAPHEVPREAYPIIDEWLRRH